MNTELILEIVNITQGVVIIGISIFTARWTYKTFAHKERVEEVRVILNLINSLYYDVFSNIKFNRLIGESIDTANFHKIREELVNQSIGCLYMDKKSRESTKKFIKSLINKSYLYINEENGKKRKELEERFEKDYKSLENLLYSIIDKYK